MTDHPPPLFFTRFSAGLFAGLLFTASHVVFSICTLLIYKNYFVISQFRTLIRIGVLYNNIAVCASSTFFSRLFRSTPNNSFPNQLNMLSPCFKRIYRAYEHCIIVTDFCCGIGVMCNPHLQSRLKFPAKI